MNQSNSKIILIGGGGHAQSINAISQQNKIYGYSSLSPNDNFNGLKWVGDDEQLICQYKPDQIELIIALSYIGRRVDIELRAKIIEKFSDYKFSTIIANTAINKATSIGCGTVVFERAFINTNVKIGRHCVINSGAIVEHHCMIGNNVQISPGAIVLGGSSIGDNTFIGAGAIIRDGVTIGANLIIPMGSIVTKDIFE